jgi:calcium-dependent protein kinase
MRFTSEEAFNHPWIQRQKRKEDAEIVINPEVIANMRNYIDSVNFKRTTLTLIASRIPEDQIKALRDAFGRFDTDGDGKLTIDELKAGVHLIKDCTLTEKDVDQAMAIMDSNKNGFIDYTEFIAACLQSYTYLKENHLKTAFSYFDKDGSGTISIDELQQCLQYEDFTLPEDYIKSLLEEVDINKDDQVSISSPVLPNNGLLLIIGVFN